MGRKPNIVLILFLFDIKNPYSYKNGNIHKFFQMILIRFSQVSINSFEKNFSHRKTSYMLICRFSFNTVFIAI